MVFLQPVTGSRLEKAAYLSAGVHKVAASPFTSSYITMRVFVEGGSIIIPQSIIINGKMDGNKIKKDSYLVLMAEIHKFLGVPYREVGAKKPVF